MYYAPQPSKLYPPMTFFDTAEEALEYAEQIQGYDEFWAFLHWAAANGLLMAN